MGTTIKQQKKVPELRFPGFQSDWTVAKLGDICEYRNGGAFEDRVSNAGQYNLITLNSIDISGRLKNEHKHVSDADWYLEKGDIVMVLSDVAHGYFLGLVDIIPESKKFVLNQRMGLLRTTTPKANVSFIRNVINSNQHYFKLHGQGSSQQNLSKGDVLKFPINLPSAEEQQKIADFLESVDAWLDNLRQQKSALEEYKKGCMQKLFTQQIRFKDGEKWVEKQLCDLLDYKQPTQFIVQSIEYSDEYKTPVLTAGKSFILGYTNETGGVFDHELPVIIFDDFTTSTQFVDFPFKVKSSAMKILVPLGNNNIKFLYEAMQHIRFEVGGHGRHWISKYSKLKIMVPFLKEQQKIADFLTAIDQAITTKAKEVTKAEQWKKGLMQKMFV